MALLAKQIADYNANQASLGPEPPPFAPDAMQPEMAKLPVMESAPPKVVGPDAQQQQINHDQAALQKVQWHQAHPWGTAENHPGKLGKIAHVLSVAGNIAGNIFAPGTMSLIPGTQLNMQEQEGGLAKRLNTEIGDESQNHSRDAQTAKTQAETENLPAEQADAHAVSQAQAGHLDAQTDAVQQPSLAAAYAHAVDAAMKNGRDPGQDPVVQHLADAITSIQKQPAATNVNAKEQVQRQLVAAEEKGDKAGVAKFQQQLKDMDPMGQQRLQVSIQGQNAANERAQDTVSRQDVRAHDKAYVQPAEGVEKSYQMMDHAYKEFEDARKQGKTLPTGAQSMLALSTHLSTTFGNVKGARVTKDMIEHHLGARSISDSALVAVQKLTNGDVLSPDQWNAFHDLIRQSRNLSWGTAVKEAARKSIPVDFLPQDLQQRTVNGQPYELGADGQFHRKVQ